MERLEVRGGELARDPPDVEVDVARRRGQVDLDADDVEPDEEAADLDALEVGEGAVAENPRDVGLEVGEVLEVYVAGPREVDGEAAVAGEREGGDGRGEDARGQAVLREELGEGRRRRWRRRRRGGRGRRLRRRRGDAGGEEERQEEESETPHWEETGRQHVFFSPLRWGVITCIISMGRRGAWVGDGKWACCAGLGSNSTSTRFQSQVMIILFASLSTDPAVLLSRWATNNIQSTTTNI